MNSAPKGAGLSISAPPSCRPQPPTETPSPGLPDPRTPFGEPIDEVTAQHLRSDPVLWHRKYWFNIFIAGVMRGEDARLMLVRMEFEQNKVPGKLGIETRRDFKRWRSNDEKEDRDTVINCISRLEDPKFKQPVIQELCNRDLDTMLVDKGQKMETYLHHLEEWMINGIRVGEYMLAFIIGRNLLKLRKAFKGEKKEERRRLDHGLSAAPNQRRQTPEDIQAVWHDRSHLYL
ncbi:hypothetical protein MMC22_007589 [Lobaria immixta]|nr:hypothetical protein [Lobaria immixta]